MKVECCLLVLLAACDPGWSYKVPGAKEVRGEHYGYELPGPSETTLLASANLFTGSLHTNVTITNNGHTPLIIRPADAHVLTRFGRPLELRDAMCRGRDAKSVTLATGEACELDATFSEQPDKVELKLLTWVASAIRPDGLGVPLTVKFEIAER